MRAAGEDQYHLSRTQWSQERELGYATSGLCTSGCADGKERCFVLCAAEGGVIDEERNGIIELTTRQHHTSKQATQFTRRVSGPKAQTQTQHLCINQYSRPKIEASHLISASDITQILSPFFPRLINLTLKSSTPSAHFATSSIPPTFPPVHIPKNSPILG